MRGVAFVEDAYVPVEEARLPLLDWGFLRSDATYDVVHVWRGSFFRLADHLERFRRGMAELRLALPAGLPPVEEVLHECVRRSGLREAYVEMICTRGLPKPGSRDPREARNAFYAFAIPFVTIAGEEGVSLHVSARERISPRSVDPTVKNYHWLDLTAALLEAYDAGAETVVLVDCAGNIVEGPGFNVFAVRDGALATPAEGMLEGVTRRTVVELAAAAGIPLREGPLPVDELRAADEVFLTSMAGGVMPVNAVDGRRLEPGQVTRRLRETYWALHEDPRHATAVSYPA